MHVHGSFRVNKEVNSLQKIQVIRVDVNIFALFTMPKNEFANDWILFNSEVEFTLKLN